MEKFLFELVQFMKSSRTLYYTLDKETCFLDGKTYHDPIMSFVLSKNSDFKIINWQNNLFELSVELDRLSFELSETNLHDLLSSYDNAMYDVKTALRRSDQSKANQVIDWMPAYAFFYGRWTAIKT